MPDWGVWLVVAGGLAVLEVLLPAMIFILLAAGAVGGAVVAALGGGLLLQVLTFAAVSVGGLALVRPWSRRGLEPPETPSGVKALVGGQATVLTRVDADSGRVKLNGEEWSARAADPQQVISPGAKVTVLEIDGATAVVWFGP